MPLLFSYGTLQQENVQLSTFGRRLNGQRDELPGFEQSFVKIEDPQVVATIGKTHHANVKFNGNYDSRVPGMVFEITDAELSSVDEYEVAFFYERVAAMLASGRQAWVYVAADDEPAADVHQIFTGDSMSTTSPISAGATGRAETQSFRARTLSASLTVKDLQKSLVWYRDVLGFAVDRNYEREGKLMAVALKAGDVRILIGQDDGARGWDRVKGEGFSLQITTEQNIDEIAKRIKERGGTLESEPADMPWGARVFRLRDPDGFKLAISKDRADAAERGSR